MVSLEKVIDEYSAKYELPLCVLVKTENGTKNDYIYEIVFTETCKRNFILKSKLNILIPAILKKKICVILLENEEVVAVHLPSNKLLLSAFPLII